MSTFTVKTANDRNLVIEAEKFEYDQHANYLFFGKEGGQVATVSSHEVFAIIKDEADKADYYYSDHESDDNFNPPNIYESEEFLEAVADAVEFLLTEDDELASDPEESVR